MAVFTDIKATFTQTSAFLHSEPVGQPPLEGDVVQKQLNTFLYFRHNNCKLN